MTEKRVCVLVVEDQVLVRADIVNYLSEAGFFVLEAACGDDAIALVDSGLVVDVLFTDVGLGNGSDGWDVGERLRARLPALAVIYASGNFGSERRPVAGSVLLDKPCLPDEVVNLCHTMPNGGPESGLPDRAFA